MKIVFLDVDGVLNSVESALVHDTYMKLDPIRVGLMHRLVKVAEAKIVVSSSWRSGNLEQTKKALSDAGAGILTNYIVSETELPGATSRVRGWEIRAWLEKHPEATNYVIVDDDGDMLEGQNFVQTNMAYGFTLKNYLDALHFLKPEHKDLDPKLGLEPLVRRSSRNSYDETFKGL